VASAAADPARLAALAPSRSASAARVPLTISTSWLIREFSPSVMPLAPGRSDLGAGRPAKRYLLAQQELSASVPRRNYGLLAKLLVEAVASDNSPNCRLNGGGGGTSGWAGQRVGHRRRRCVVPVRV